jgi:adenosylmethionine-8-amino-7-oxononanoate aminotransferase
MLVLGKGITAGYMPGSAVVASEKIYQQLFDHAPDAPFAGSGSTADGHPASMAAALAVLEIFEEDGVLAESAKRSKLLRTHLDSLRSTHEGIAAIHGVGMMIGVEMVRNGRPLPGSEIAGICRRCESNGLLVTSGSPVNCVMFMPPLTVTDDEVAEIAMLFGNSLSQLGL